MKIGFLMICFCLFVLVLQAQGQTRFYRHEFQGGIGVLPIAPGVDDFDYIWGCDCDWDWRTLDLLDRECHGNLYTTGDLSVSYGYYFWRWFKLGMDVSYTRFWQSYPGGKESSTYTTLMPFIHFHWFNRFVVSMYSGMGIGVDFIHHKDSGILENERRTDVGLQFTFYGISVGRRWFGFAEAGIGNLGILRGGFGYRF